MGYHYDMINNFCRQHDLTPHIIVAENASVMMELLKDGVGDVIAYNMPVVSEMKDSVLFCGLEQISHQVLIQRTKQVDSMVVDVTDLIGKTVTLLTDSKHHERIINLNNEIGGGVIIDDIYGDTIVTEDLIRMVSHGEFDFTVAEDDLAKINQTYFSNIDVHLPVSFDQRSSWVVRKNSPILADSLNSWIKDNTERPAHIRIIKRYFEETKGYSDDNAFRQGSLIESGVISPYDILFRRIGEQVGIDWRLLASIAYQESAFDPDGSSWAGATGIMGLMPRTAASLGVELDSIFDPEVNITAGAQYLKSLIDLFDSSIDDSNQLIKMSLAAYNGGIGHIADARALAEKYDADKNVWDGNVEKYIQLKRLEQYYNDPVCNNGYFRGDETVDYVIDIINRWSYYIDKIEE